MSGHTPGRLHLAHETSHVICTGQYGGLTAVANVFQIGEHGDAVLLEATDNARRLVACWNACDGLPTDLLEDESIMKISSQIHQERDNLLTAIGECRDAMPSTSVRVNDAIADPLAVPDYVRESVAQLTAQRDELLAALDKANASRIAAQTENAVLKGWLENHYAEHRRDVRAAVLAERQAHTELLAECKATLQENGHLADGEQCTLIRLKRAVEKATGEKL